MSTLPTLTYKTTIVYSSSHSKTPQRSPVAGLIFVRHASYIPMRKLGFRVARDRTIAAVQAGPAYIQFEDRSVQEGKNLLDTGEVDPEDVVTLLRICRGTPDQYLETPHHREPSIPVHTFKPVYAEERWYIKVYFLDGTLDPEPAIFISVHKSNG
jgi:hypothetical protein